MEQRSQLYTFLWEEVLVTDAACVLRDYVRVFGTAGGVAGIAELQIQPLRCGWHELLATVRMLMPRRYPSSMSPSFYNIHKNGQGERLPALPRFFNSQKTRKIKSFCWETSNVGSLVLPLGRKKKNRRSVSYNKSQVELRDTNWLLWRNWKSLMRKMTKDETLVLHGVQ